MILLLIVAEFYCTFGSLYICQWRRNNISIKSRSQQFSPEISDADEQWRRQQLFFNNTDKLSRISPAHYISSGSGTTTRWSADSPSAKRCGRITEPKNVVIVYADKRTNERTNTRLIAVFPGLPGWASTRKVKPIRILLKQDSEWQWHQLGHMIVCISIQTANHASTPPLYADKRTLVAVVQSI